MFKGAYPISGEDLDPESLPSPRYVPSAPGISN